MLVEFLDSISIDKKPFIKNLRIKIDPQKHQLRLKAQYIIDNNDVPIDVIVFNWDLKFDKFNPILNIIGEERVTKNRFCLNISYNLFKQKLKVNGHVNGIEKSFNVNNIKDFLNIQKMLYR